MTPNRPEFNEFQNIARRPHPRYYLKRSNDLIHVIYTNGIVRASVCLGSHNELEPYLRNVQLRKGYWRPISKNFIFENLFRLQKKMISHVHILVKENNGKSFGYEIGFQQELSSFEDFFARNDRLFFISLQPGKPENHNNMGYHIHLLDRKQRRTNVITMFNKQYGFTKLLGEYHAEGHNNGEKINVASLGRSTKKQIFKDCCFLGRNIKIDEYKICGKNGFTFYP
ncbi:MULTISPECIES: hypothetical protein [unclassified Fibrobacter]|uniref:hypothetical protein n=1 Tax=unclassified Fibrobacter TaxID=2634177 RepID=UPI0025BD5B68|nr:MULTISPECIES: hypothetical protein [unclassified Fibrobacter]